jgi:hypothetical protein
MHHKTRFAAVATASLLLTFVGMSSMAADRSMRCGRYLIYGGGGSDSAMMYEVLKKCGEPEAKNGNTWIYTQGSTQRVLTFNYESRLASIESRRN